MRVESDSLGKVELPAESLYGVRTFRCIENTDVGSARLSAYPELVRALAVVKRACAEANLEAGFLEEEIGRLIFAACDEVLAGIGGAAEPGAGHSPPAGAFADQFPVDMLHGGGYIGFNGNINEVLANLANIKSGAAPGRYEPVCPKSHLNLHQSTADVCATAARLAVIERSETLLDALGFLKETLVALAARYAAVQTVARTCLMDAMPVSIGEMFGAWAAFVDRRSKALQAAVAELYCINLGGTVIGSGCGAPENYRNVVVSALRKASGRDMTRRANLYDAAQNIDDLANVSAQLTLTADGLIKIAGDIRLLASGPNCGFGELKLPAVQEGSSFFSGKVNPVIPETLMQVCMQISGFDRAVQAALQHGELNLNVFEGVALKNILDAEKLLEKAIVLFTEKCLMGMEVDAERCAQHLLGLQSNAWATAGASTVSGDSNGPVSVANVLAK